MEHGRADQVTHPTKNTCVSVMYENEMNVAMDFGIW